MSMTSVCLIRAGTNTCSPPSAEAEINEQISNLIYTTRFWNNLHHAHYGNYKYKSIVI